MKKLLTLSLLFSAMSYGQVGIGVDLPHQSAELHVVSKNKNKGILIPEISLKSLEDKTVIEGSNPIEGLVVFNIIEDEALKLSKGFYYWGKIRVEAGGQIMMGWNKLISQDDLQKSIVENRTDIAFEKIVGDPNTRKTPGFKFSVNGNEVGVFNEALTKFSLATSKYYVLLKDATGAAGVNDPDERFVKVELGGDETELPVDKKIPGYEFNDKVIEKEEFVYIDESGKTDVYELKNIIEDAETLTTLRLETNYLTVKEGIEVRVPALVYKDEINVENPIFLDRLLKFSEALTELSLDTAKNLLIFKDEKGANNEIDINAIVKTPWNKVDQISERPVFSDNIHTSGWVGIGFDKPSTAPNEKLRVNGSVTAVNSYYADYVFDAYFNGESSLKYDYKFNNLNTVESFIKQYNHLPGITPISKLNKSENGYSFNLSELSIQLLEKTEELYLHTIDQSKEIESLRKENEEFKKRVEAIERLVQYKLSK